MRITIEMPGTLKPRVSVDDSELAGRMGNAAPQGDIGDALDGGSPDPDMLQALGGQMPTAGRSAPAAGNRTGTGAPPADDGGSAPSWLAGVIEGSLGQPMA
jgi:hypothetical protein